MDAAARQRAADVLGDAEVNELDLVSETQKAALRVVRHSIANGLYGGMACCR